MGLSVKAEDEMTTLRDADGSGLGKAETPDELFERTVRRMLKTPPKPQKEAVKEFDVRPNRRRASADGTGRESTPTKTN